MNVLIIDEALRHKFDGLAIIIDQCFKRPAIAFRP